MGSKTRIAIFASGNGSNAENLVQFALERASQLEVSCLITDQMGAGVLKRAEAWDLPSYTIPFDKAGFSDFNQAKIGHEEKILAVLNEHNVEWVCLAGYMKILSSYFLEKLYDKQLGASKVINIHPSLLPSFPGKDAYKQAYFAGVKMSGVTVHFVDSGVDTGLPILQDCFPRLEDDTLENFVKRGLSLEYKLYREVLKYIIENRITLNNISNSNEKIVSINQSF